MRDDYGSNLLFQNRGDGRFNEVAAQANVARSGIRSSAPIFADFDGDGRLDLFVLTFGQNDPALFKNLGNGTFMDVIGGSGLADIGGGNSSSLGDIDRDGDLDLYIAHWQTLTDGESLWKNNGMGNFIDISTGAGIFQSSMNDLTANFSDIGGDGWPDLLVAADFGTSQVFHNNGNSTFLNVTTPVISDENGMGASVGDYDNDGDLDWFVTSIYESDPGGLTGNRLYRNAGDGSFEDVTSEAGVRVGHWGWGSCFQDFNNDGHLDLFHVNGWPSPEFLNDPSVMFISNGDGTFLERSLDLAIDDSGQGRGLVCFDYDRDGDIDIFIANNRNSPKLLRNDRGNDLNFIHIKLEGPVPNTEAIGAKIYVTTNGIQQMRELRAGSNFVSQDPAVAHFGVGATDVIDEIRIVWPTDQSMTTMNNVPVNQFLVIQK